ncbi:MAG: DUF1573 domain-containing protein [Planctomycetota bacterium]
MRSLLLLLSCIGLGFGLAKLDHDRRFSGAENLMGSAKGVSTQADSEAIRSEVEKLAAQKVGKITVVNGAQLDFGMMMKGTKRSHKFVFKNVGEADAKIWFKASTCKCTVGKFTEATLKPDEQTDVELEWKAENILDEFSQTATIGSNCPSQEEIKLVIRGRIGQAYTFDPPSPSLGDILSLQENEVKFRIYSFQEGPMDLGGGQVKDSVLSKKVRFEVGEEKILQPGEIPDMADARRYVDCKVTLLPGLPAGPVNLELQIERRNAGRPEEEFLFYTLRGRVVTPVRVIAGDDYNETRNILTMGTAKSSQGLKKSFMIAIRTEDFQGDPNVRIGKVIPEGLKATLGTPKISATQRIYPVLLELPPGSDPVELDGTFSKDFGKIVIETDMETSPIIPMYLKFRVTED